MTDNSEQPLRIWWNRNLHGKISPGKLAAHAAHAALRAYGIPYDHPIVVLAAGKAKIEAMPINVHDNGLTELEPGTLTTGVDTTEHQSWAGDERELMRQEILEEVRQEILHWQSQGPVNESTDDDTRHALNALRRLEKAEPPTVRTRPVTLRKDGCAVQGTRMGYGGILVHDTEQVMGLPDGHGSSIWPSSPAGPNVWAELSDDQWADLGWTVDG